MSSISRFDGRRRLRLTEDQLETIVTSLWTIAAEHRRRLDDSRRRFRALPPHSSIDADERNRIRREATDAFRVFRGARDVLAALETGVDDGAGGAIDGGVWVHGAIGSRHRAEGGRAAELGQHPHGHFDTTQLEPSNRTG